MNKFVESREVFASAARTATATSGEIYNTYSAPSAMLFVIATASSATPSVVFTVETYCEKSATWVTILTTAAVTGASENVYMLGAPANVSNVATIFHPGKKIKVIGTAADSDSLTYSAELLWVY